MSFDDLTIRYLLITEPGLFEFLDVRGNEILYIGENDFFELGLVFPPKTEAMEKDELIADIEQTINWLTKTIDPETYNLVPFEGSWTAGQVVEHVTIVAAGFDNLLKGSVEPTTRPVDAQVERIKTMFLDMSQKAVAGASVTPVLGDYDMQQHLAKLDVIIPSIINSVATLDLNMTCTGFDIPTFGNLTRLEAVYFFLFHTKRHVNQLENIVKILNKYQPQ